MAGRELFIHEDLYRGPGVVEKIQNARIFVCGAGCLGGNLIENLFRCGFGDVSAIDMDRIEPHNVSTQPYYLTDVGAPKIKILASVLYDATEKNLNATHGPLTPQNIHKHLRGMDLVVDSFDNTEARGMVADYCREKNIPCLHIGMSAPDGYGDIRWNEGYTVPGDAPAGDCNYPLARNLVLLTVVLATEVIFTFLSTGEKKNKAVTLGDLKIHH